MKRSAVSYVDKQGRQHHKVVYTLSISENVDEQLKREIERPDPNFTKLVLVNQLMLPSTTLPKSVCLLRHLTTLDVSRNNLICLPDAIGDLITLERLDAGSNKLTAVPKTIGKLVHLQHIQLNDNYLASLPSTLIYLVNLIYINVTNNLNLSHLFGSRCSEIYTIHHIQQLKKNILNVALETWRPRARSSALMWLLVARRLSYLGVSRDVAQIIGRLVYASRGEEIWEGE